MEEDRWYSLKEMCDYLGVSRDTILGWISNKDMPTVKMGKCWKFKKEDVDQWLKAGSAALSQMKEGKK